MLSEGQEPGDVAGEPADVLYFAMVVLQRRA